MATALVTRTWRPSTPEAIEHDLAALWRDVGRAAPVARAVMSNLVVFHECEPANDRRHATTLDPDVPEHRAANVQLDAVVARHPSRVILLEHQRGEHRAGAAPFSTSVGVVAFGPPHARYAVEEVAVRSTCTELALPSIVRPLLRGDVPTSVWWMEDGSTVAPLDSLVALGRQLVYDSRRWRDLRQGIRAMSRFATGRVDLADLNWRRLTPVRRALVHAAGSIDCELRASDVVITHRPGDGALAWLLCGWLAARLRWPAGVLPRIEEARRGDDVLSLACELHGSQLTATLNGHRVVVRNGKTAPLVVGVPHETDADAIASELRTLASDGALGEALAALSVRLAA